MTDTDQATSDWKAPYVGYSTLRTFIDKKCGENPIPPRIDKTFIDNVAGGVQPLLMGALKVIGFIREDGTVNPLLNDAASSPDRRKEILRAWAEDFYAGQLELAGQNATAQMLFDSFSPAGITGSTLRKAVGFYLALVEDVGLPNSPHFKLPKQTPSTAKKKAPRVDGGGGGGSAEHDTPSTPPEFREPVGEKKIINLGEGGTIVIYADVKWLSLSTADFTKLRTALDDLDKLSSPSAPPAAPSEQRPAEDEQDDEEGQEDLE
jgi:hypothetical protein